MMRRVGTFCIGADLIEDDPLLVQRIMGMCVIVRAECLWDRRVIEYTAISSKFAEIEEGLIPIVYDWVITSPTGDTPFIEARPTRTNGAVLDYGERIA